MAGKRALVMGSNGGIGRALVDSLAARADFSTIYAASRRGAPSGPLRVIPIAADSLDEASLASAASRVAADGPLDLIIVATGLLHRGSAVRPEKSIRALDAATMAELFAVDSIGPALAAKHLLPLLVTRRRAVTAFLSARVGSIGDNRLGGWHSYRASKASLNALMRCFAIETSRRNPEAIVAALHSGTVDTALSQPFQARVPRGSLQSPAESAAKLLDVIDGLAPTDGGGFFAWDGAPIPF